jgi:hypothetical protein
VTVKVVSIVALPIIVFSAILMIILNKQIVTVMVGVSLNVVHTVRNVSLNGTAGSARRASTLLTSVLVALVTPLASVYVALKTVMNARIRNTLVKNAMMVTSL